MKKTWKALMSFALIAAMVFGLSACGSKGGDEGTADAGEAGKVLNIWCWNDEFQPRFNDYYAEVAERGEDGSTTTLKDGTVVNWIIEPNEGNNYQTKLDEALLSQESADTDSKVDMFLVEADYARKYTNSDASMNVADITRVLDATADQHDYTKTAVSKTEGNGKG